MIDKITLYREVLELEPGSRVFFPLAKLLAEKEPSEAINILKKGLTRHPDHIEARIFLIELLSANDGDADLDNELEIVSSILRNYPAFWKIWSAHLAQTSELQDAALAINFFGAGLSGRPITWSDVIAQGLNALLVEAGDETTPPLPSSADYGEAGKLLAPPEGLGRDPVPLVVQGIDEEGFTDEDEGEELFSLRTRTMADLLAEQGDYAGAIDIYNEIFSVAPEAERAALEERLRELEELRNQSVVPGTPKKESVVASDGDGGKLVSLLESLASRFENRARE